MREKSEEKEWEKESEHLHSPWLPWQWMGYDDPSRIKEQVCLPCIQFHEQVFNKECQIQMIQCRCLLYHADFFEMSSWDEWKLVSKTWYRCFREGIRIVRFVGESWHAQRH